MGNCLTCRAFSGPRRYCRQCGTRLVPASEGDEQVTAIITRAPRRPLEDGDPVSDEPRPGDEPRERDPDRLPEGDAGDGGAPEEAPPPVPRCEAVCGAELEHDQTYRLERGALHPPRPAAAAAAAPWRCSPGRS